MIIPLPIDKTAVHPLEDAILSAFRLSPDYWEITGATHIPGDLPLFSRNSDKVLETRTSDIRNVDLGLFKFEISCRHGLRHCCETCGKPMDVNCWVSTSYKTSPIFSIETTVSIRTPKMHCRQCGTYHKVRCPLVVENHTYTRLLKLDVIRCLSEETVSSTAENCCIGKSIVESILEDTVEEGKSKQNLTGTHTIYLDEIQSTSGHNYITMVANEKHECICGVLGHDIESVRKAAEYMSSKGCNNKAIEYASADMSPAYKSGVSECFPKATLILDHFHITKGANETVDKVRKRTTKRLKERGLEYPKHSKYTVLFRRGNLKDKHIDRLREIRAYNPELALAYDLKEEFFEFFDAEDKREARSKFFSWRNRAVSSGIPEMVDFARRMMSRLNEILRWFSHKISNGVAEGLNNVYKKIKSAAYGFRKPENLIRMCMFRKGNLTITI